MIYTTEELSIGQKASFTKTITETDVYLFAGISGDINPAHVDEIYAHETSFKRRIVHGMILGGLISATLGMKLPGPGTIYVKQTMEFRTPVYFGDTITASVEIVALFKERNRAVLKTICCNQDKKVVLVGEAEVMPPRKP